MGASTGNFAFLAPYDERLVLLGAQAEGYFHRDPVVCITRLRQFAEVLAQETAARVGLYVASKDGQAELLARLRDQGTLPREVGDVFHTIRRVGNRAVHENEGSASDALGALKFARNLGVWFHRTFGDPKYKAGPFVPPPPPQDATAALRAQVDLLKARLAAELGAAEKARQAAEDAQRARMSAEDVAKAALEERAALEALFEEAAAKESEMVARLAALQAKSLAAPAQIAASVQQAEQAASLLDLDEADTRRLIDEQLRERGWEVDSFEMTWSSGVRPQKGKHVAIAEVPTERGPADYVLFAGLEAIAIIEAKRAAKDVAGSVEQAKRYARAFIAKEGAGTIGGPWGEYRVPFLFATNGRPYLKQLATKSGIWFLDARRPQNTARPLVDWYTPEGLLGLLQQDFDEAHAKLSQEPTEYLGLREYQLRAIRTVEEKLEEGQREILLAMATGVGKTRTCIGLCYRLLKTKRFRRILFLVDRSALGIQAANAFKDARLENLQTFTDIFDMKELADLRPDLDTKLQIATVQGMVKRVVLSDDDVPPVDAYDCIVIDECHRGYLLDREMSDTELSFRSEADYISKYRRVVEHFDAVKIGLTATPAIHTTEIFGAPVYQYSYREAVIDGWLVDHEPPTRLVTALAEDGIHWKVGEEVETYSPVTGQVQLSLLPDEVHVDIEHFNKTVLTEGFNRVVCEHLAKHIDPTLPAKTLVFCVTDAHADMVVHLFKEAFTHQYGACDDDAVVKITGNADKPLELIRRLKNERMPNVAVTVDLLTTGVDVPSISNIVFLRRVRSRILYEQMLGRATRLHPDIGKEVFHIYDAVDLYSALAPYSAMKPVVANPTITFAKLIEELATVKQQAARDEVLDQLIAKLTRKKARLRDGVLEDFEAAAGMEPQALVEFLKKSGAQAASAWFAEHASLGELLDRHVGHPQTVIISHHEDHLRKIERGYGKANKPDDYLEGFAAYLQENLNALPALLVVTQRPRDLTRQQLKELKLALDQAGYSEATLRSAWRDTTNQDIAASIIGHIRRAALGDPLVPYDDRVRAALERILKSRPWTAPQRSWLDRIGKQLVQETIVDKEALDSGQFQVAGGFKRLNTVFEGELEKILGDLNEAIWDREGAK